MKVLSNLFGLNKKISASDIAVKDNNGKAKTLDNYLDTINEYSTDEKIIGKWIDGKPIYRKVINSICGNLYTLLNELNIDFLIDTKGNAWSNYNQKNANKCAKSRAT